MLAIFKREFKSYFLSPIGYIYLAAMYFFLGLYFWMIFSSGVPAVPQIIYLMSTVVLFVLPVLTMRMLSEDRRQKVDQALLTAPVKLSGIILGKFWAAMAVFSIGFAPTVIFEMIVASFVDVNVLSYVYMLLGMLLYGGTLIAIGMFISSLTDSTAISAIVTFIVNLLIMFLPGISSTISSAATANAKFLQWIITAVQTALDKLAITNVFDRFYEEVFYVSDVIYLVSFIVVFLFLSVRSLEKRRWA